MKKFVVMLSIITTVFIFTACGKNTEVNSSEIISMEACISSSKSAETVTQDIIVPVENYVDSSIQVTTPDNTEVQAGIEDTEEVEMYSYEVEQKTFYFSIDQDQEYQIPYVRVSGLQDTELQWKINHTLWENACWIFDCAELTNHLYCMFDGSGSMQITGIYKYKNYLSVVYEGMYEQSIEGHIAYAIVVDMLTGERVLMDDMIVEPNEFKELLLHYFDGDTRIIRLFIFEEDADEILFLGSLTEAETVYNDNPSPIDGTVSSISYLFDVASFYMTEEAFVVLPGARNFEPLYFEWEDVEGIVKESAVKSADDSYAELKSAVDKIDFSSTFPPGEDLFGEEYRQLILCKTPFWVPETGKEIYLNQLKQLDNFMLDSYELDELVYYYFDIDGDNVAELGVTDEINFRYLFDYSEQDKRIILWKEMSSTWYNIIGTRKICWNNGGNNIAFYSLGEDGKDKVTIRFYSWEGPNKETGLAEIYYTVTFPNQEEYFSVTKEQYEEITGRYFEAEKESRQKIGEVSYSYQEMLELLNKEQGSCNSQSKTDKIKVLECIYADELGNAEIYYPKLIGFNDKDKEKKINELIFKDIERVAIEGKNEIGKDFTIELKYDMKFIDENIISIFYYGMYGENSEGHGLSATAITTNIDINNEKLIMLKDIIIDYEELGRLLLSDKFRGITVWEGIRGTDTISREYLGNEEKLVENLKNEEFDIKNHYIEWYIDGDEFVIVSLFSSIYQEYSMEIESMGEIFSEYFYELHKREHKVSSVDR